MDHTIIKEAATKIVANIKAMEDDITALRNKQDIISISDTTMTGSYPGRLSIEEIGGKSEQFTTTGKNILENTVIKSAMTNNNVTFTPNTDGSISASGTPTQWFAQAINENAPLEKDVSYTLSGCPDGGSYHSYYMYIDIILDNNEHAVYRDEGNGVTFTYPTNATKAFIAMAIDANVTVTNIIFKPMIRLASITDPTYEPYTGGQPSPNPDYPQEIKKVVVSEIKTHGKNLLKNIATSWTNNGVTYVINNDGSIIANGTASAESHVTINAKVNLIDKKVVLNGCPSGGSFSTYRIQINGHSGPSSYVCDMGEGVTIIPTHVIDYVTIYIASGVTVSNLIFKPMIRKEGTDPTYEPYTESTITLSQPIELYGIGDVQDTIEDGKVVKKLESVVFDGSENWYAVNTATSGTYRLQASRIQSQIRKPIGDKETPNLLCANFIAKTPWQTYHCESGISVDSVGAIHVYDETFNTADGATLWKAHLQSNPMTVVYELAEPIIEPLPAVDQTALNSLKTYEGVTYIEFDSEIEPTFKAEYGVTKLGGYTLEGALAGANGVSLGQSNTDRITALEATLVNNI